MPAIKQTAATKAAPSRSNASLDALIADTYEAIDTLNASRRETIAEHNERSRKLRGLAMALHDARSRSDRELFDVGPLLSPELSRLIVDPTFSL